MLRTEDHAFAVGEYALSTLRSFLAMEVASLLRLLVVGVALDTKRKLDARTEVRSKKTLPQNEKYNMKRGSTHTPEGRKGLADVFLYRSGHKVHGIFRLRGFAACLSVPVVLSVAGAGKPVETGFDSVASFFLRIKNWLYSVLCSTEKWAPKDRRPFMSERIRGETIMPKVNGEQATHVTLRRLSRCDGAAKDCTAHRDGCVSCRVMYEGVKRCLPYVVT